MSFYFGKKGGVDFYKTFKNNHVRRFLKEVRNCPVENYDLVINDFEPVSAWACKLKNVNCISLSHQSSLLSPKVPQPSYKDFFSRMILKYYAPAIQSFGMHFKRYDSNIYLPIIRNDIPPDKGAAYKDTGFTSMSWPGFDKALTWLPLWNTIVLLSSSLTVHHAHVGLKNGNRKQFNVWLGITVTLAVIFVFLQAAEYYEAYTHYGLTLNSGIYGSTFFMLTGFHGFHVMMGGIMLGIMLARSLFAGHFEDHDHFGFEAASWYWHFVDVVWVMLFLFVYIL